MASKAKRLTRPEKNRLLGGVCAGLGQFFGLDVTLIRLIFILITLFGGSGILFYLILWLIIPSASSSGDISEENIKKGAEEMKNKAEDIVQKTGEKLKGYQGENLAGALLLLFLGIILLLNNFNFLSWDIWATLWRFWPVFLIIWGLKLVFQKSKAGNLIIIILAVMALLLAIFYSFSYNNYGTNNRFRCNFFDGSCRIHLR